MAIWNPWHGCHKISPGCVNCYVYRRDESIGKDASIVAKTGDYNLPIRKNRQGRYKLTPQDGVVFTCMTSDFFLEDADAWRPGCWDVMRERRDLRFAIITKRIERAAQCFPPDWGDGWDHVTICSTCEDQARADQRLPVLLELPVRHREVVSEPMLGPVDMEKYLATGLIEHVTCGGESGPRARPCDFKWIQEVRRACVRCGVAFTFKQTGAVFIKDGRTYHIDRKDQMPQARKSGMSYTPGKGNSPQVKVGSLVSILDCENNESMQVEIVPSYDRVRYTTMGYKKRNYVELTRTSDADGSDTVSDASPIGKAMIGKHAGEEVSVDIGNRILRYRIIAVSDSGDSAED